MERRIDRDKDDVLGEDVDTRGPSLNTFETLLTIPAPLNISNTQHTRKGPQHRLKEGHTS